MLQSSKHSQSPIMSLSILGATAARPIVASRNLIIASSSYLPSSTATCQSRRTVVHHARPPRRPRQATHLEALEVKATAGTSRPNPTSQPKPSINSVSFNHQGVELELHHVPPPTAPDYTSGRVPDVLRWLGGANDVRADAQGVGAPFVRSGGAASAEQVQGLLSNEVVEQMRQLRAQEPLKWSRSALMRR